MAGGWHEDPLGRYAQRYHDGEGWTSFVSNAEGVTEDDPLGTQPSPPGTPKAPPVQDAPDDGALPGSPWARLGGALIDGLVVGVPALIVALVVFDTDLDLATTDGDLPDIPLSVLFFVSGVFALYETLMVGRFGRTVGKMAVGLTIVTRNDIALPTYGVAASRALAYAVLYSIPIVGIIALIAMAIMIFADPLRQTPHDKIAGTVVARTKTLPAPTTPG